MNYDNCVIFKGTKEGITIYLDENTEYDKLKQNLEKKIAEASKFFKGVKTNIFFRGKAISAEQQMELLQIISATTNMNIAFMHVENEVSEAIPTLLADKLKQHNISKFYKGNIRSGQVLEFTGSMIIIGDVNPGALVRAEGNIVILGALKGTAHAGCNGMTDAFVAALSMKPVQLRIADIITRFPDEDTNTGIKCAEYAYIEDGQIYVVPLH